MQIIMLYTNFSFYGGIGISKVSRHILSLFPPKQGLVHLSTKLFWSLSASKSSGL